jgi:hypothetical protein
MEKTRQMTDRALDSLFLSGYAGVYKFVWWRHVQAGSSFHYISELQRIVPPFVQYSLLALN